ncbi:hypothetical protein GT022_17650 [Agaribacter marinus]|uniref:Uncharacterized protein n=1 Tax=Virgibacillus salarius TaxID=447199 RepID=A0A941DYD6_9BACI|nr:hypothetical protein [Virgibacillus salarius]MBR7797857.1 hypothetical protein [Virgibacillus salarius]NAZ10567.1 hypothetical protein [Agaribacter marinus]WBX81092.1 hypothetical protein PD280_04790 [Virgibacillus salarius]
MSEQWYTNKELFEQISSIQGDFKDLRSEMQETRKIIRKYNGLREELGVIKEKVDRMEAESEGKESVSEAVRLWSGWLFGLLTLAVLIIQQF